MKFSDILIIYLACGAPFGVYFFLQHRTEQNSKNIFLKSAALAFVWIPYALRLLHDFITINFRQNNLKESAADKLSELQKQISQALFDSDSGISVFEFREVIERYTGLTLALNAVDEFPSESEEEIFRVALRQNIKLGAECLRRRNRSRIELHQTIARKDFLQLISELSRTVKDIENLRNLTAEFVKTLGDTEAQNVLREIFDNALQSGNKNYVRHLENEIWTPKEHQLSSADKIPIRLQTLTAAGKD